MKGGRYTVLILLFLAILIFAGGIFFSNYTLEVGTEDPVITGLVTGETDAEKGDLIEINFVLTIIENGKVVDANDKKIADEWNIKNYVLGPFRFFLGKSGKVKGFDKAIIGMVEGEEKTVIIPPSAELKQETIPLSQYFSRRIEIPKFTILTKKGFTLNFNKPPVIGLIATRKDAPWDYKVINMTETKVAIEMLVEEGDDVIIPGKEWKSQALIVKPYSIVLIQNPKDGQEIETEYGTAIIRNVEGTLRYEHTPELDKEFDKSIRVGQAYAFNERYFVKEINENSFVIKKANYLEQEELELKVELLKIS